MMVAATALSALPVKAGDAGQAMGLAERPGRAAPSAAAPYLAKANALLAKSDAPRSEAALREASKRDPASLPVQSLRLNLEIQQGRARGSNVLPRWPRSIPANAGFRWLRGLAWFSLRDLDQSEPAVKLALQLDLAIPNAETFLANIVSARGLAQEVKAHLRAAYPRSHSDC